MTGAVAELDRVSYRYPNAEDFALRDLSLTVRRGEFLGVVGPTGAGKTTLCLALNGIVPQFYGGRFFGHLRVAGLDTLDYPISRLARHVSLVFEDPETQLVTTSVENEVAFALENLCVPPSAMRARIADALEAVRLAGQEKRHPHDLSSGQKQRLALAAALATRPELLVLDEPTSQLDPVGVEELFATAQALNRDLGVTVVMTGHAAEELAVYADRIALLAGGRIVAVGPPEEVYARIDLLQAHDLRAPQVAYTFHRIKERVGEEISQIPVRIDEALGMLASLKPHCENPPVVEPEAPPKGTPLLSAQNLTHVFEDGVVALRDVSVEIYPGEYVLIAGRNGAGKTTLVKHFLNLLHPTSGTVRVGGLDTARLSMSDLARRIGYVAQNPDHQIFNATVEEEVAFALHNLGYDPGEVAVRVEESLEAMDLVALRERHPLALPKGDRARVVIAAILAMYPEVVIFDEPTTGQDFAGARAILDLTRELHARGKTVVVITHHLYLMTPYARRVIVLGQGSVALDAPLREAFHRTDLLRANFLAPPQAVLLARKLERMTGRALPLVTPEEVAACFGPPPDREVHA